MVKALIRKAKLIYSSSPLVRKWANGFAKSNFYFSLMKRRVGRQKEKDKRGPFNLVIETSSVCNARCVMCPYRTMKRAKKIMDEDVFENIVEKIKVEKVPINKVFFSGLGEPLADPRLVSRLERVKSLGLWLRLYTNASLLTDEIAQKLVKLGLDEINISFNGTNPWQYKKIMGLDFQRTVKNIENLLAAKRHYHVKKPFVQISSVIIQENKRDIETHFKQWRGKVDAVTVSLAHQWGGGVEVGSRFGVGDSPRVYPCRSLWHTFVIDSQGNFVVCCRDYESRYILGNIKEHSFADIQKSPVLGEFRRAHLKYSRDELPAMCRKCNFPYQDGVEWFLPRSID